MNSSPSARGFSLRRASLAAVCAIGAVAAAHAVDVSNVSARQRWPWNNLVDIDFTLSGTEAGAFYQVDVAARFPGIEGDEVAAKSLVTEPVVSGDGAHRVTWDLASDHPGLVTSNFTARVTVTPLGDTAPVYMVIDLSAGPTAAAGDYKVRYTTQAPDLSDDTCRTTEMWLRRCPAGTFTMGCDAYESESNGAWKSHEVTLSQPFYIGIFECTQQQYYQVLGTWPSYYSNEDYRATRPVENVAWDDVRSSRTYWLSDGDVWANGFIGKMRTRTGILPLDLPTEAQWEYAARAGTSYRFGWAGVDGMNLKNYARCTNTPGPNGKSVNVSDTTVTTDYGTAKVGSYPSNNWGIYDMLGNVQEMVGDAWHRYYPTGDGYTASDFTDPRGDPYGASSSSLNDRIVRGGSLSETEAAQTVYHRNSYNFQAKARTTGFRVVVTVK